MKKRNMSSFLKQFCIAIVIIMLTVCAGCGGETDEFFREVVEDQGEEESEAEQTIPNEMSESAVQEESKIYIDIEGAVVSPGVYELNAGDRVYDVIEAAGGVLPGAYMRAINQAAVLSDGQQIIVPTEEEYESEGEILTAGGEISASGKININTAVLGDLCTLTGIGEAKAASIIRYREEHGSFGSIEELMQVEGIKEGTYNKIKDNITV